MEAIIMILMFVNGAVLASCFFIAKSKANVPISNEEKKVNDLARQWNNFLNYDGTSRGQKEYED